MSDEGNEQKSARVTSSLGALLTGLSSKKEAGSEPKGDQGFNADDIEGITDWSQLGMMNKSGGGGGGDDVYEDEHEDDCYADKYGGNFIKLKYIAEGKIGYYCEICHAEMNAKKSLELHCSGMKHLKKKDIWEKNGRMIIPGSGVGTNSAPPPPPEEKEWRSSRNRSNDEFSSSSDWRSNRNSSRGGNWNNSRNAPPAPSIRGDDYGPSSYRDRDHGGRKYYDRQEQSREPLGRDDYERDSFYDRDRRRGLGDYFRDSYRDSGLRDYRDRREEPYFDRWGDRFDDSDRSDYGRFSPKREPYPDCRRPMPREEDKLVGGPTGSLLQKLGDCCVKSNDDAELAMNVISNLSGSLKDFYSIRGEAKVADLLGDVELKLKTIKALKVGLKVLGEASFCFNDEPPSPVPVPAPVAAPLTDSLFGTGGFSANQPVRYPVAGLYRPPVKY
ncbi:uncharacterized protein LOC143039570 isoform X2 [Oratosquilla oratoria]|uniref:uncharacterized protein LOC143039570 isoform X2 n=1 Tax=Oratosquilla oratoria TaxID=337810 RepID=UPI003F77529C